MAIDKSNSKPWVKITVWILTIGLMFAFMGTGVWMLLANWNYLFSSQTLAEQQAEQQMQFTDDDIMAAYEQQIAGLEGQLADDPDGGVGTTLAGMSADYANWLTDLGDATKYTRAIELYERAAELDPDNHAESSKTKIDALSNSLGE